MMTAAARIMSGNWNGGLRWWFAECLSSLYINAVTSEALENNANDPTSQKGMPLDMCNSEWAREPVAMRIFMRESSRSTPQENCKAAKPVCDYLSNSRARLQTNSATRVVMMWSASATYCNKYWVETLHLHARYTQRQCSLQMAAIHIVELCKESNQKWILSQGARVAKMLCQVPPHASKSSTNQMSNRNIHSITAYVY